jgi:hypothetical protein
LENSKVPQLHSSVDDNYLADYENSLPLLNPKEHYSFYWLYIPPWALAFEF